MFVLKNRYKSRLGSVLSPEFDISFSSRFSKIAESCNLLFEAVGLTWSKFVHAIIIGIVHEVS